MLLLVAVVVAVVAAVGTAAVVGTWRGGGEVGRP